VGKLTEARRAEHPRPLPSCRGSRVSQVTCSIRRLCVRCSIMKVVQFRFKVFREIFGRTPNPDEPIFFADNLSSPVLADRELTVAQVKQAAIATGVNVQLLLKALGLHGRREMGGGLAEADQPNAAAPVRAHCRPAPLHFASKPLRSTR
jgi:hypothetical protein